MIEGGDVDEVVLAEEIALEDADRHPEDEAALLEIEVVEGGTRIEEDLAVDSVATEAVAAEVEVLPLESKEGKLFVSNGRTTIRLQANLLQCICRRPACCP